MVTLDVSAVAAAFPHAFDVVTSRSFADVPTTTRFVDALLMDGGMALISEPPIDRSALWTSVLGAYPALVDNGVDQGIRRLHRRRIHRRRARGPGSRRADRHGAQNEARDDT